jgi:hypothetical protein
MMKKNRIQDSGVRGQGKAEEKKRRREGEKIEGERVRR